MTSTKKKLFISHASNDKTLADKLVDLLTNGCAVNPNDILCTSLEGKGIPAGKPSFIDYLREQIQTPDQVILLLSENFFASRFCLCELGAVWAMGLPNFPLVVPPTDKGKLKATLAVTQSGYVNSASYLDELRDGIKETIGTEVPTATWNVKRDSFLLGLDELLKALPRPTIVPAEKLKDAQDQYQAALTEIGVRDRDIQSLKSKICDLEKCKDAAQVKTVARKYSSADDNFTQLCRAAAATLDKLRKATRCALYWEFREEKYHPSGDYEWDEVREAESVEEVRVVESEDVHVSSRTEHPRVAKAENALRELDDFLHRPGDSLFADRFKDEHDFPASIGNKDFWGEFLANV